jgi:hypothetical protein
MRILRNIVVLLACAWLAFCGLMYYEMRNPPAHFAMFMSRLPGVVFLLAPFETMWNSARAGTLKAGDQAPDFRLKTLDQQSEVSLSTFRGSRPVVLIFGSYT